jgi:hypothetical protein
MIERTSTVPTTWLRTDRTIVPTNGVGWSHLIGVENALQRGLFALKDVNHPEFYEIEVGDNWYYIHIPSRIASVYLIAVAERSLAAATVDPADAVGAVYDPAFSSI